MFREGLGIRSILTTLIRQDIFSDSEVPEDMSWEDWINIEGAKWTKFMVFCNFNFHCIVFNISPSILSSRAKSWIDNAVPLNCSFTIGGLS